MTACNNPRYVVDKLASTRAESIWPNGRRYLWTDAFGVVLLVSLYAALEERRYLDEAEWVVAEVDRVLGRSRGIRIGEAPDRDGQYFHYLAMWFYALSVLGRHIPDYGQKGLELVRQIHDRARQSRSPDKERSDPRSSSRQRHGSTRQNDAFDGYVSYRLLDEKALSREIADIRRLIDRLAPDLYHPGSRPRHDAMDEPVLYRRRSGSHYSCHGLQFMACSSHFPGYLVRSFG